MSYSFTVSGNEKSDVLAKMDAEMDKIVARMPDHAVDRLAAVAAAHTFMALVDVDADQDVALRMHGSIWKTADGVREASVGITVSATQKAVA